MPPRAGFVLGVAKGGLIPCDVKPRWSSIELVGWNMFCIGYVAAVGNADRPISFSPMISVFIPANCGVSCLENAAMFY